MHLKTLTYTSRASLSLTDADLERIATEAQRLNALDGITGLLAFDGSRFLQIIEGSEEAIDDLLERLRNDRRHSSLEVRDERLVEDRSFPSWSMQLVRVSAGYLSAKTEIATSLPDSVSPAVRSLALKMSQEMASSS
jgi:hypothetical protein